MSVQSPVLAELTQADISVVGKTIRYQGEITAYANRNLFNLANKKGVKILIIKSQGGSVKAAIDLGTWVYKKSITVQVDGYCLSSCANYVFTAATKKLIQSKSVVAWHGNYNHLLQTGLWMDEIKLRMHKYRESYKVARKKAYAQVLELVALEKAFFKMIDVDERICWVGKVAPYNVLDFYVLSGDDMKKYGVSNVHLPDSYMQTDLTAFDYQIDKLVLH